MKETKISALEKAISTLQRFLLTKKPTEIERAGIIQAFEFCYEVLWRALKNLAESEGLSAPVSPRKAFKAAFEMGLIEVVSS